MRDEILAATAKLISKNGVKSTSTRIICETLGITAPTLYHYFEDKSALMDAVVAKAFDIHLEKVRLKTVSMDPIQVLRESWQGYIEFVLTEPEFFENYLLAVMQGRIPDSAYGCFQDLIKKFEAASKVRTLKYDPLKSSLIYLSAAQGVAISILSAPKEASSCKLQESMSEIILNSLFK